MSMERRTPPIVWSDARGPDRPGAQGPWDAVRVSRSGGWSVLELEGDVDIRLVPHARRHLGQLRALIVVDLSRVTFLDASGLGLLAEVGRIANDVDGFVRVVGPSPKVRRVLALAHLGRGTSVVGSLAQALSAPGPAVAGPVGPVAEAFVVA